MHTTSWLDKNAPGFLYLAPGEREAIMHFTFLWSLFEAEALKTMASVSTIKTLSQTWETSGKLNFQRFELCFRYFQNRYFQNGMPTSQFDGLNLRAHDDPALVTSVLKGDTTDHADQVTSLLIIIYRLRNNLFHGLKWASVIKGQLDNFSHANIVLMAALETHRSSSNSSS